MRMRFDVFVGDRRMDSFSYGAADRSDLWTLGHSAGGDEGSEADGGDGTSVWECAGSSYVENFWRLVRLLLCL